MTSGVGSEWSGLDARSADGDVPAPTDPVAACQASTPNEVPAADELGATPASTILERMGFRVGDLGLLLPAQSAREVVLAPPTSCVPNTVDWLLGLANVRGNLVPVVDTAMALGTKRAGSVPAYALIFGEGDAAVALLIDGLPRLLNIDVMERLAGDVVTPDVLAGSVTAAYEHGGRIWLDLDRAHLLDTLARAIAV